MVQFHNFSFLFVSFSFDLLSLGTTWRLASGVVKDVSCLLAAYVISSSPMNPVLESFIKILYVKLISTVYIILKSIYLFTTSVFVNMKIPLSTVSRHLASKNCLILFLEQKNLKKSITSFKFSPATAHILHEQVLDEQCLYDFGFSFHGSISKVTTTQQKQLI